MEQHIRELYCSRIIAGYIRYNKELRVYWPNKDVLYEANEIYMEVYNESRDKGLLTNKELYAHMLANSLLESDLDSEVKALNLQLDSLKIEAFNIVSKGNSPTGIKSKIEQNKARTSKLLVHKHRYDHLSCEGVATFAKWTFILDNSLYLRNGQRYAADDITVTDLLEFWNISRLTDEHFRELARTDPWTSYWQSKATAFFALPDSELNDEQRRMVMWSKMYDNIRESPDAPSDTVFQDDDALDGWLLIQRKKRERDKKSKQVEDGIKSNKIKNSQDVMVKAWTPEQAGEINSLNDADGNMYRGMRLSQVNKKGSVEAKQLNDAHVRRLRK